MRHAGAAIAVIVLSGLPAVGSPCWKPQASIPAAEYPLSIVRKNERPGTRSVRQDVEPDCRTGRLRALELMGRGKYRKAIEWLDRVVGTCPRWCMPRLDRARASMLLGYLRWNRGLVEKAVQDYKYCCTMHPGDIASCWLEKVAAELLGRIERTRALPHRPPKQSQKKGRGN